MRAANWFMTIFRYVVYCTPFAALKASKLWISLAFCFKPEYLIENLADLMFLSSQYTFLPLALSSRNLDLNFQWMFVILSSLDLNLNYRVLMHSKSGKLAGAAQKVFGSCFQIPKRRQAVALLWSERETVTKFQVTKRQTNFVLPHC